MWRQRLVAERAFPPPTYIYIEKLTAITGCRSVAILKGRTFRVFRFRRVKLFQLLILTKGDNLEQYIYVCVRVGGNCSLPRARVSSPPWGKNTTVSAETALTALLVTREKAVSAVSVLTALAYVCSFTWGKNRCQCGTALTALLVFVPLQGEGTISTRNWGVLVYRGNLITIPLR